MSAPLAASPNVDPATVLRRIEMVNRSWPGEKIDRGGCLRFLGSQGSRPPIFWTFNTAVELPALAAQLPNGQCIVGTRSLNEIVDKPTRQSTLIVAEIAEYYARHLVARFGTGPCIVGGNCQAAEVAWHIAVNLIAAGVDLQGFITLDADWQLPLPVPVRMIFGRTSRFNPQCRATEAQMARRHTNWRALFPAYDLRIIDGNHGEYFIAENIGALSRQIFEPMPSVRWRPPPRLRQDWRLRRDDLGLRLTLPARQMPMGIKGVVLAPLLGRISAPPLARPDLFDFASLPERKGRQWQVRFGPAVDEGLSQVVPLLCAQGIGPLTWPPQWRQPMLITEAKALPASPKSWRAWISGQLARISDVGSGFPDLRRRGGGTAPQHQDFREVQLREDSLKSYSDSPFHLQMVCTGMVSARA